MGLRDIKIKRELSLTGKEWSTLLVALSVYIESLERLNDSCKIPFVDYLDYLSAATSAYLTLDSIVGYHEVYSSQT